MTPETDFQTSITRLRWHLAAENVIESARRVALLLKANFDPNQPRVPAGNPDGGQWTRVGGSPGLPQETTVEVDRTGPLYAATEIGIDPSALTGMSTIDETTVSLARTLATVVDGVGVLPGAGAARYGTLVHTLFATAVRLGRFRGIGVFDVETTFPDVRYGAAGSIRTDVILRNDVGDIIAIYDVKTGGAKLEPRRIRELRAKTGAGPNVPIIEMHIVRGVTLKKAREHTEISVIAYASW